MTREEAQQKAEDYLAETAIGDPSLEAVIIDDATQKIFCGWLFHYQSRRYIETGDIGSAFGGNAPILIDARDASLHITGTAYPSDYYIQNYRDTGDTGIEPVPVLTISGWRAGAEKIAATRLLNRETSLGLAKSKDCIDRALDDEPTSLLMGTFEQAEAICYELDGLGWNSEVTREAPNKSQHHKSDRAGESEA